MGSVEMSQWTDEEIQLLHDNWEERMSTLLELLPNRSISSIQHKIKRLGYQRDKTILTGQDYDYIIANISSKSNKQIAKDLNVSPPVITRALQKLGINKTNYWTQSSIDKVPDHPFSVKITYEKVIEVK